VAPNSGAGSATIRIVRALEEAADRGAKEALPVEAEELPERPGAHRLKAGEL